jgi:release factor glutamine methyltransferase
MNNKIIEVAKLLKDHAETPVLDAQVLLAWITGRSRSWVMAHPELELNPIQEKMLTESLSQLISGVPLPYVIGKWEFYGLEMIVSQDVLIPRPETELLVDKALDWLRSNPENRTVIDSGTGSGCIAVALADRIPDLQVIATDISEQALVVARQNAIKHKVADRIEFECCNLFPKNLASVWSRFSTPIGKNPSGAYLITANLPYIPTAILKGLKVYGREPELALDGGDDGLVVIQRFFEQVPMYLEPGGIILMEIEASQGISALSLARDNFSDGKIHLYQDLSGRDRILEINS